MDTYADDLAQLIELLDLPVPLRPMMHTRSPRAICQDTLSNNGIEPDRKSVV